MSFLAPLFLLGGLAVALPVIFHLIRNRTRDKQQFSSLMFLRPTPPKLDRKSRIENWPLLLLRCLALILLALAFSRPFWKDDSPVGETATPGRLMAILIDNSASMRRSDLWEKALETAREEVRSAGTLDSVGIWTFNRSLETVMPLDEWNQLTSDRRVEVAEQKLDALETGWLNSHLGTALIQGSELIEEDRSRAEEGSPMDAAEIVVISDMAEGNRTDGLQGYLWPERFQIRLSPVESELNGNAGIQPVATGADSLLTAENPPIYVRVHNAADSENQLFQVGWSSEEGETILGEPIEIYLPPGKTRMVQLPATNQPTSRILLKGDSAVFDNVAWRVPLTFPPRRIAYLGNESPTNTAGALFFLDRAFGDDLPGIHLVTTNATAALADADQPSLLVATDITSHVGAIRNHLSAGQNALITLAGSESADALSQIVQGNVSVQEAEVGNYALLGWVDYQHPLFTVFNDPRYSDFSRINFWKHRTIDTSALSDARVIARFDSDDPALVEIPVNGGRLFVLATTWRPEDSQLALSTKFVPLLLSFLDLVDRVTPSQVALTVGDPLPLAGVSEPATIILPNGTSIQKAPDAPPVFTRDPGIYRIESSEGTNRYAVNLDSSESRTANMDGDKLLQLGVPLENSPQVQSSEPRMAENQLNDVDIEAQQKNWRWLLFAGAGILLVETWLAGHFARRRNTPA